MKRKTFTRWILSFILMMTAGLLPRLSAQVQLKEFIPGEYNGYIRELTSIGGTSVYMAAYTYEHGVELWKTDGTCPGTVLVKDIAPGTGDAYPSGFTAYGGKVLFEAQDGEHGSELWATDGTQNGTVLVKDINPGDASALPRLFTPGNGVVYFSALTAATGNEIWRTNGTGSGTFQVTELAPGNGFSSIQDMIMYKDTLFFIASTNIGYALWKTDGTASGTVLVRDMVPFSNLGSASGLAVAGGLLFFKGNDNVHGTELWVSDGSTAGTVLVKDIQPGSQSGMGGVALYPLNNGVFFTANDAVHGLELWFSDGTETGTFLVKDVNPGPSGAFVEHMTHLGTILYFNARDDQRGDELWRTNGTEQGTFLVKDINPGNNGAQPREFLTLGNVFYFNATDGVKGFELWRSDGTGANTVLEADIEPGSAGSNPTQLTPLGTQIVFTAATAVSGEELWRTGPLPAGPPVAATVAAITHQNCYGEQKGAIDITVNQGDCPFHFFWTGPLGTTYSTEDIANLRAGTYTVTITDAKGSSVVLSGIEVTEPDYLDANYTAVTPPDCMGNSGSFTIAAAGGTPPYKYLWDNGLKVPAQSGIALPGANFKVTITDARGCAIFGEFGAYAEYPYSPYLEASPPVSCYGALVHIREKAPAKATGFAGDPNTAYHWEAGPGGLVVSSPDSLEVDVEGAATYYLTSTWLPSGCTRLDSVVVGTDTLAPSADAGADLQVNCSGEEVILTGSASSNGHPNTDLQVEWTAFNGGRIAGNPNDLSVVANHAGAFVLSVQNTYNGCTDRDTVLVVSQLESPDLTVSGNSAYTCLVDQLTLIATLDTATGTFDGWYTLDGLYSTDLALTVAESAGYTYLIAQASNPDGCVTLVQVDLLRDNEPIVLSISVEDTLGCGGLPLNVTYTPYDNLEWHWTGPDGYTHDDPYPFVFEPGWYYVTVSGTTSGCIAMDSIEVIGSSTVFIASDEVKAPKCAGGHDGEIRITLAGGSGHYQIEWSNGATGPVAGGLGAGEHWVGITDLDAGCYIVAFYDIFDPEAIQVSLSATAADLTNNGTITCTASGGTPPYTYGWSNSAASFPYINGLAPGTYTLTLTDAAGCSVVHTVVVPLAGCTLAVIETAHQDNACGNQLSSRIEVAASGGTPPYAFLWSTGATTPVLTNYPSAVYILTVTDAHGCSVQFETEIRTLDSIAPTLKLAQLTRSLDASGQLSVGAWEFDAGSTDNCGAISFSASSTQFDCSDLGEQFITVTATDANGNTASGEALLIVVDQVPPVLSCPASVTVGFCDSAVSFAIPQVNDEVCVAFDPKRLTLLSGLPSGAVFPVGTTLQSFRYTKLNGLSDSCNFAVTVAPGPSLIEGSATDISCAGACDGTAGLGVLGGVPPFSYTWSNGQTGFAISGLCAGTYTASITDAYGCTYTALATLQEPPALVLAPVQVTNDTNSLGKGAITLGVSGGTPPYLYAWYLGTVQVGAAAIVEGLYAGEYYCVVTDAHGCTAVSAPIAVDNIIGTDEPAWASGLILAPNPAHDAVQLRFPSPPAELPVLQVLDLTGRPMALSFQRADAGLLRFSVRGLPAGVYLVRLTAGSGAVTRRLVVEW